MAATVRSGIPLTHLDLSKAHDLMQQLFLGLHHTFTSCKILIILSTQLIFSDAGLSWQYQRAAAPPGGFSNVPLPWKAGSLQW